MPKISIIVPCYNVEKYIAKCLDSLLNQTFRAIEILCVNDGSNDETLSILNDYTKKDLRIKVFSQENLGIGAARNRALQEVHTEYVMFCDADDWYDLKMCDTMYKTMLREDVDFVTCASQEYVEDSSLEDRAKGFQNWLHLRFQGKVELDDYSKSHIPQTLWNKIFKTDLIKKYHINFPELSGPEDIGFFYSYLGISKTGYFINIPLYSHLTRHDSIQGIIKEKYQEKSPFDHLQSIKHAIDFLSKWGILSKNQWVYVFFNVYTGQFLSYLKTNEEKVRFLQEMRSLLFRIFPEQSLLQACLMGNYNGIIDAYEKRKTV